MNVDCELGSVNALFRHPVKSMPAVRLEVATLGWHGFTGDRRFAFRKVADQGGFPRLTARNGPLIHITMRDQRCVMINLDPDTAQSDPELMKTVIRLNENHAGVYGAVVRPGELFIGQPARLRE